MDKDIIRHGKETVHKRWNNNTAILSGDAMLAISLQMLIKNNLDDNNNPKCIELTLINKKYLSIKKRRNFNKYPIYGLDYPNLKRKKDIDLRFE